MATFSIETIDRRKPIWVRAARIRQEASAWAGRVFLAVADQGLISGSNFAIGILLARWMKPEQYGAYALAFSVFLLLSQFQASIVLEPMAVFGSSTYRSRLRGYLGSLFWIQMILGIAILACLAIAAGVTRALGMVGDLPSALAGVTLAAPCVLMFWLVRRSFYLDLAPAWATFGSLIYSILVLGGLWETWNHGRLNSFSAFLLMGVGGLLTSAVLFWKVKPVLSLAKADPNLRQAWGQHWDYGRWALATAVLLWIPSNIYLPMVGAFGGMASVGELKALTNLALPVGQTATALSLLFQSHASHVLEKRGAAGLEGFSWKVTTLYAGGAAVYWIVVTIFRHEMVSLLYGGNYDGSTGLVPWLALASVFQLCIAGPCIGLRALQSPASVFAAYCVSSTVSVAAGIPLTRAYGLRGAIVSMMTASLTGLFTSYVLLHRKVSRSASAIGEGKV